jgi:hypothetical protein
VARPGAGRTRVAARSPGARRTRVAARSPGAGRGLADRVAGPDRTPARHTAAGPVAVRTAAGRERAAGRTCRVADIRPAFRVRSHPADSPVPRVAARRSPSPPAGTAVGTGSPAVRALRDRSTRAACRASSASHRRREAADPTPDPAGDPGSPVHSASRRGSGPRTSIRTPPNGVRFFTDSGLVASCARSTIWSTE